MQYLAKQPVQTAHLRLPEIISTFSLSSYQLGNEWNVEGNRVVICLVLPVYLELCGRIKISGQPIKLFYILFIQLSDCVCITVRCLSLSLLALLYTSKKKSNISFIQVMKNHLKVIYQILEFLYLKTHAHMYRIGMCRCFGIITHGIYFRKYTHTYPII